MINTEYETLAFESAADWRQWLDTNHTLAAGIWIKFYKKASGIATVTYAEALDDALCYGWIDGIRKTFDDRAYIQKFTPRRKASLWSKRNIEYVDRLTRAGLMMPAGVAEVERAKADGRWAAAYDKPSEMQVPDYFISELEKHPAAKTLFATLNKTNRYAIAWRLQTAKTAETQQRRMQKILALLDAGQKLH